MSKRERNLHQRYQARRRRPGKELTQGETKPCTLTSNKHALLAKVRKGKRRRSRPLAPPRAGSDLHRQVGAGSSRGALVPFYRRSVHFQWPGVAQIHPNTRANPGRKLQLAPSPLPHVFHCHECARLSLHFPLCLRSVLPLSEITSSQKIFTFFFLLSLVAVIIFLQQFTRSYRSCAISQLCKLSELSIHTFFLWEL